MINFHSKGDCADPVVNVQITETIVHENYSAVATTPEHDIALIRLARPISNTDFIRPICLPVAKHLQNKEFESTPLTIVGFGRTENGMYILFSQSVTNVVILFHLHSRVQHHGAMLN